MAEFTKGECNCESCRLQRAAPAMYEALKAVYQGLKDGRERLGYGRIILIKKALSLADGKEVEK